jgi:hypothetical protein
MKIQTLRTGRDKCPLSNEPLVVDGLSIIPCVQKYWKETRDCEHRGVIYLKADGSGCVRCKCVLE